MKEKLQGVIIPIITALTEEGNFDEASQEKLIRYLAKNGVQGIFALGLTGEVQHLTESAKRKVMDKVSEVVEKINTEGGSLKVVIGVNSKTSEETLGNIRYASKLPIEGIVIQPSSIQDTDYSSLIKQTSKITQIPIYLYSNPNTAIDKRETITPENIIRIGENEKIVGIKISDKLETLLSFCKTLEETNIGAYIGNAIDLFKIFDEDNHIENKPLGVITGPGNLFPKEWIKAWNLKDQPDNEEKQDLLKKINAFKALYNRMPGGKNTTAAIKYLLYAQEIIKTPKCLSKNITTEDKTHLSKGFERISRQSTNSKNYKNPF